MQKSSFKKKPKNPKNPNSYYNQNYQGKPQKAQNRQNRYPNQDQYIYKKKKKEEPIEKYVYKQELIQKGFEIARSNEIDDEVINMIGRYPECFETKKRNVMFEAILSETENNEREENIEEIKKDFKNLVDNEEIPDWFLDGENENNSFNFNFGNAVEKTKEFQKEIILKTNLPFFNSKINSQNNSEIDIINNLKSIPEFAEKDTFQILEDANFEELDKYLEQKAKDNYFFNEESSVKKESFNLNKYQNFEDSKNDDNNSQNNSNEFFFNLEDKIKNMLDSDTSSDKLEDSNEESFNEELGFQYTTQKNPILTPYTNEEKKTQTENITTTVHNTHINKINIYNNVIPNNNVPPKKSENFLENLEEDQKIKITEKIEERLKISDEEREKKKKYFIEKYGYLDPILCQIVYETLNSKKRKMINKYSLNGFNQKSVEKYCQNNYKIFSMYLQGNIISKVWFYKDKMGNINGPFMSYDMDIWNGEGDYFSNNLLISLHDSEFLPIQLYVDRDPIVVDIVESFVLKSQKNPELLSQGYNDEKKFKFKKKNSSNNSGIVKKETFNREKLENNFDDNFPALDPDDTEIYQPKKKSYTNNKNDLIEQLSQKPKIEKNVKVNVKGTTTVKNRKMNQKYERKKSNRYNENNNEQYQKKVEKKTWEKETIPEKSPKSQIPNSDYNMELTTNLNNLLGLSK